MNKRKFILIALISCFTLLIASSAAAVLSLVYLQFFTAPYSYAYVRHTGLLALSTFWITIMLAGSIALIIHISKVDSKSQNLPD